MAHTNSARNLPQHTRRTHLLQPLLTSTTMGAMTTHLTRPRPTRRQHSTSAHTGQVNTTPAQCTNNPHERPQYHRGGRQRGDPSRSAHAPYPLKQHGRRRRRSRHHHRPNQTEFERATAPERTNSPRHQRRRRGLENAQQGQALGLPPHPTPGQCPWTQPTKSTGQLDAPLHA